MIRRTVAVTVRVVVEAKDQARFDRALDQMRENGPPAVYWSDDCKIDRILQSHAVVVEPEKKRGKNA